MKRELSMDCPVEFGTIPDCDCPYEHWHVGISNTCLDIHFEDDGSVHVTLDASDWEAETIFHGATCLADIREYAFSWAAQQIGASYSPTGGQ